VVVGEEIRDRDFGAVPKFISLVWSIVLAGSARYPDLPGGLRYELMT